MHKILETARGQLVMRSPFISCILLSTELVETKELPFPAATDGHTIYFNVKKLLETQGVTDANKVDYTKSILAHEVYHMAFLHMLRVKERTAMVMDATGRMVSLWNIATDAVINALLKIDGFNMLPGYVDIPGSENKSAEQVYDELLKQMKNNKQQVQWISYDDLMSGDGKDKSKDGKEDVGQSEKEQKLKMKIQKALDVAKATGKIPGSLSRLVEQALDPKINWKDQLREAVTTIIKRDDYTWSRLNRRYVWNNMYMPGFEGQQTGPVFLAFDTSGSIGQKELTSFLAELNAIFEDCTPESISVGFCDCTFYSPHMELSEDDLPMEPKQFSKITRGGGGTAFKPVFDYIKQNNIRPDMLIYFTDLYGSEFGEEPPYPVLWVTTGQETAPWGKIIKLEL